MFPSIAIIEITRGAIRDIGYEQRGFHWNTANVEVLLHEQSVDIAQGVDAAGNKDEGAGDQGIMFGYAVRETPELMPAPIYYSHKILELLAQARHSGKEKGLGPDAKSQVTVRYDDGKPVEATQIVLSHQHVDETLSPADIRSIAEPYIREALPDGWITNTTVWHVNPTGKFFIGGPDGDAGLTGRKIIVDTYGGAAPHGGGAFSGKDPTKVDRSAAYAARYLAKNIVAAGLADRCTLQLSYAIGVAEPLSIYVDLHGTGNVVRGKTRRAASPAHAPLAARDSRASSAQSPDLRAHLRLWSFRPHARRGRRLLLGEDRPRRPAEVRISRKFGRIASGSEGERRSGEMLCPSRHGSRDASEPAPKLRDVDLIGRSAKSKTFRGAARPRPLKGMAPESVGGLIDELLPRLRSTLRSRRRPPAKRGLRSALAAASI